MKMNFGTPLSRSEMKNVIGGLAPTSGTCAAEDAEGGMIGIDNVSMKDAKDYATAHGTHWCCDSCSDASWYSGEI